MAGFRKAKAEQAALKLGFYGPPGSGKSLTALLCAEGLAAASGKRIAYVDTERGTDFYCQSVPTRNVHPDAFDFDAIYTRSVTEAADEIRGVDPAEYGVIIIDSVTHIWEATVAAYDGKKTRAGTIPFNQWGKIKKPYKDLMGFLISSPMHLIICGRQGVIYEDNEETGQTEAVGLKMKAEGETPYEPHILIRMEATRPKKSMEQAEHIAYVEKDRTGVLSGRSFVNPTFDTLCAPLMGLLGGQQAQMPTGDEAAAKDSERLAILETERAEESEQHLREFKARIDLAPNVDDLKAIGKQITQKLKARMLPDDVAALREAYLERESRMK